MEHNFSNLTSPRMYDKKIKSTMHSTHQEPFDQDFEIQEFLAQGTFAKVFKCVERKTGCTFAVKAFHAEDNHFDKEQINSEIDVWRALQHRNIVSFHKPFYERNSVWVVLEFVKGKTLFDEIVNGKEFTEEGSRIIMQQTIEALDYLHRRKIVHRDVKADNIILQTTEGKTHVKLTDFGLARRLPCDSEVIKCDLEGAPLYLAPETILADPIGTAVDIWACGVVLFLLLVGHPPFWQNDDKKLMSMIVGGSYHMVARYWDQVSDDAIDLVKRMLVVHPHKRVTAFKALNHPWITDVLENGEDNISHKKENKLRV